MNTYELKTQVQAVVARACSCTALSLQTAVAQINEYTEIGCRSDLPLAWHSSRVIGKVPPFLFQACAFALGSSMAMTRRYLESSSSSV